MPLWGRGSSFVYLDGYDIAGMKPGAVEVEITAETEETTGINDTWKEHTPTGVKECAVTQSGAIWNTATNNSHAAFSGSVPGSPQATVRVLCVGFAGDTAGQPFVGAQGTYTQAHKVLAAMGAVQHVDVQHLVSGQVDQGEIVLAATSATADFNTESAGSVDSGASSANGAVGYQQVTSFAGFTGYVGKIRDSADDSTFADLITFDDVTSGPNGQRKTVAGNVDQYLAYDGNVTGTGTITVWAGLSRN